MTQQLDKFYTVTFQGNIEVVNQQLESRFAGKILEEKGEGKLHQVQKQIGKRTPRKNRVSGSSTPNASAPKDVRWVKPNIYDDGEKYDTQDKLKMGMSIESSDLKAIIAGIHRQEDIDLITAAFGNAQTGEDGTTLTAFDTNNVVAVDYGASAATGLTAAKIKKARALLIAAETFSTEDEIYCVITAQQELDLLNDLGIISTESRGVMFSDEQGKIEKYLGVKFIHSELLPVDTNSYREVLFYASTGLCKATWKPLTGKVTSELPESSYCSQIFAETMCGFTRTNEAKVYKILCSES